MPSADDVPATLGRYVIERVLGRGAMGIVYLAFDPQIERQVALKTLHRPAADDAAAAHELTARFLNEARAAGRLVHPNIVAIYDYGEADDIAFITMEYVRGESLAARLARHARTATPMNPASALRWFAQLLDALDYAHEAGIVHRDIKPANLLISRAANARSPISASPVSTRRRSPRRAPCSARRVTCLRNSSPAIPSMRAPTCSPPPSCSMKC